MQLPTGPGATPSAFTNISVASGVSSGSQVSTVWGGLTANHTYEWYVAITNEAGDSYVSPAWTFTTSSGFHPSMVQFDPAFEAWRSQYGITDPNADDDGDGQSNYSEYLAGTDPTNARSVFKIVNARPKPGGFSLTWSSVGGRRYRVQYSDNLAAGFVDLPRDAQSETDSSANGEPSQQSFVDATGPTNSIRYYRIMLMR
jgi:hypothetical protein